MELPVMQVRVGHLDQREVRVLVEQLGTLVSQGRQDRLVRQDLKVVLELEVQLELLVTQDLRDLLACQV